MRLSHALAGTLTAGLLFAASAQAQTNLAFCGQAKDGALECVYATMTSCEQNARSSGGSCIPNPAGPSR